MWRENHPTSPIPSWCSFGGLFPRRDSWNVHTSQHYLQYFAEVGKQTFLKSPQSQIRKYWVSVRYRKSAKFYTTLCLKTVLKVYFYNNFFILYKFELEHYMLYLYSIWKQKSMHLRICGSFKSVKRYWVRTSQIHKLKNPQIMKKD